MQPLRLCSLAVCVAGVCLLGQPVWARADEGPELPGPAPESESSTPSCDIAGSGIPTVADVQTSIKEALGLIPPTDDLNADGVVNVVDVQIAIQAVLTLNCAANIGCSSTGSGLAAWWPGNGYLEDIINGNNGVVEIHNPTYAPGKAGQAFSFNGANQYFSVNDSPSLDAITSAFTVAGWIDPQSDFNVETLFSRRNVDGTEAISIYLNLNGPGSVDVRVTDTVHGPQDFHTVSGVVQFGQWQFFAATANWTTGVVSLYWNGQPVPLTVPGTLSGHLAAVSNLYVGAAQPGTYYYEGLLEQLQWYGVSLTELQIQTIMQAPAGVCSAPYTTTVTGTVLGPSGNPVAGVVVSTLGPGGTIVSTTTASNGTFTLSGVLGAGPITIGATGTVGGTPLFGASSTVAAMQGGTVNVGNVSLGSCSPPVKGLVSWWPGNGYLEDIVSGNNGVVQIDNPGYAAGEIGQAFSFNDSPYFGVNDAASLDGISGAFTVSGWIHPQSTTNVEAIFTRRNYNGTEALSIYLNNLNGPGSVDVRVTDSVHGPQDFYSASGLVQFNQWQYFAATANLTTGEVSLYWNGQQIGLQIPGVVSGQLSAVSNLYVGASQPGTYYYEGLIDELQLYGVALTQAQIQTIMQAPVGVCTAPFTTTVTGTLVDPNGNPVSGAVVSTLGPTGTVVTATTASNGTFTLSGVVTSLGPVTVGGSATVGGTLLSGTSSTVNGVQGGTVNAGTVTLGSCAPPVSGLVSWWPANGYLEDIVNGNNGLVEINNPAYMPGEIGQAFSFNGANQYFGVNDSASLDGISGAFTVSGWIHPQSDFNAEGVFSRRNVNGTEAIGIYLNNNGPGSVDVRVSDSVHGEQDFYSATGLVQFNQWQYFAATANVATGVVSLYWNGQQIGLQIPGTLSGELQPVSNLYVGTSQPGSYYYEGLIDELQLYGMALTQAQLQTIMAAPAGVCTAPFTTTVTGTVVDPNGNPVSGAVVSTLGPTGTVVTATTASNGTFTLSGVVTSLGPVSVGGSATIGGTSMFGASSTVTGTQGGTVNVGNIVLSPCVAPVTGLVSWWPADGNLDDIVSGNTGVLQIDNPTFATGQIGQAFRFNGSNEYISVPDSPSLDAITGAFTVSGWVDPQSTTNTEVIFTRRNASGTEAFTIYLNLNGAGSVDVRVTDTVHGSQDFYSAGGVVEFNQWQYFAATANLTTGDVKLYWNGQQIGLAIPTTLSGQLAAVSNLYIGAAAPGIYSYEGLIDELQLYSVELTQLQIEDIYFSPTAGVCRAGFLTSVTGLVQDTNSNPIAGAIATTGGGASTMTASDGTFTIPNVLTMFSPLRVDAAAVVNGNPVFGNSSSVTAVAAGTTSVGPITLSGCSPAGLVSLWPGNGNANDIVGGNSGTFSGAAYANGLAGQQAFSFNGSNGPVSVPDSASLDALSTTLTLAGWINPQPAGAEALFDRRNANGGTEAFAIYFNLAGNQSVTVRVTVPGQGQNDFASAAYVIQYGQWQYLAAIVNMGTGLVKLYLNGQPVELNLPVTLTGQLSAVSDLFIGGAQPGNYAYSGLIDELELYNVELSQAQIQNIYSQGGAGMCQQN